MENEEIILKHIFTPLPLLLPPISVQRRHEPESEEEKNQIFTR
jgi:hypothetical protein